MRLTAVGQGDLSVAGCDGLVIARTQGQKLKCCFVHAQQQIYGVGVLNDSPIRSVAPATPASVEKASRPAISGTNSAA